MFSFVCSLFFLTVYSGTAERIFFNRGWGGTSTRRTMACVKVSSRKVQSPGSVVPAITHQVLDSAGFRAIKGFEVQPLYQLSFIVVYIQDR